ncbi:MAG: DUF58 domain-containing protein [Trueperaceae bacterium]|nr:DUF58 domain-containing protein [Trueperaceae bacterium]
MISAHTRALLDRYALASKALSRFSGERLAKEAGQSVEFYDFRPYQPGDELRYVDWKVYARTEKLYTRLYQAERNIALYVVLDNSPSMRLGSKAVFAKTVANVLSYVAQRDSLSQVFLLDGSSNRPVQGRASISQTWAFIDRAKEAQVSTGVVNSLKDFALKTRFKAGAGLVLVISDLFDAGSFETALVALKTRGLDASFIHIMADADLHPDEEQLELHDLESGEKLVVGPDEVRAYKKAVSEFLGKTRTTILRSGFRHALLKVPTSVDLLEREALSELIKAGILIRR